MRGLSLDRYHRHDPGRAETRMAVLGPIRMNHPARGRRGVASGQRSRACRGNPDNLKFGRNHGRNTPNVEAVSAAEGDQAIVSDSILLLEAIAAERDRLEQENNDLNQRVLRLAAEFDNFRKRTDREKSEMAEYGAEGAVRAMLPILDDFERAVKVETAESEYTRGMNLIHQRMVEALAKLGLEPIDADGKPFDPNLHNAIDRVESAEIEEDTVASVYQRGYTFKGRLLRAAMVRVAVPQ